VYIECHLGGDRHVLPPPGTARQGGGGVSPRRASRRLLRAGGQAEPFPCRAAAPRVAGRGLWLS
jgi:hypothetical protein